MSCMYFHSVNRDVKVSGSERMLFGRTCSDIAWSVLSPAARGWGGRQPLLKKVFPADHYVHQTTDFYRSAQAFFVVGNGSIIVGADKIDPFPLVLNTAYRMGSDPVKLAARLHGQCEIHTYVEGVNRVWLSGIIKEGLSINFFRENAGWGEVIQLLEEADDTPVVTSYSVCDRFPNDHVAGFNPPILPNGDVNHDAWYQLPAEDQWGMAIKGLRERGGGLELKPENWRKFHFDPDIDANKLVAILRHDDNARSY